MKKIYKIILYLICSIIAIVAIGIFYLVYFLPDIPLENIKVDRTQARIERGEYLANHVMVCMDCHSTRDWSKFSGPIAPGKEGLGGEIFNRELGFPGIFYSKNITPFNLMNWSDAEIYRAITSGVNKQGDVLFPVMPYMNYGKADKEDIYSIIAYIRSLQSKSSNIPPSEADFPLNILMHTFPKPAELSKKPDTSDKISYGKYLVLIAGCAECHTPFVDNKLVLEKELAGGREFDLPWGKLVTPNLTPDKKTGIGSWSEELFVQKFKAYDPQNGYEDIPVADGQYNTIMPWKMYGGMKIEDLKSIYKYLHSLKPISHKIQKFIKH